MTQYIVARLEEHSASEMWGPFPSAEAAMDWLARYDGRFVDFIWEQKVGNWFAVVADGDIGLAYYQVRPLDAPVG